MTVLVAPAGLRKICAYADMNYPATRKSKPIHLVTRAAQIGIMNPDGTLSDELCQAIALDFHRGKKRIETATFDEQGNITFGLSPTEKVELQPSSSHKHMWWVHDPIV